jgi:hypothetical protein
VLDRRVAIGDRDAANVQLRGVQREPEGERVVDSGIGIDDDGKGTLGGSRSFAHEV